MSEIKSLLAMVGLLTAGLCMADQVIRKDHFDNHPVKTQPEGYSLWRADRQGECGIDAGGFSGKNALKIAGVNTIAYQVDIPVQPGEVFYISGRCRQSGEGKAVLSGNWKSADKKWNWGAGTNVHHFISGDESWQEAALKVRVPDSGVAFLSVVLGVEKQKSEKDVVWFDDIQVIKLDERRQETKTQRDGEYFFDFENDLKGLAPEGWIIWLDKKQGKAAIEPAGYKNSNAAVISGASSGAFQYDIPVKPGETYLVEGLIRQQGDGKALLGAFWKKSDKKWNWSAGTNIAKPRMFEGEWKKGMLKVTVPEKDVAFLTLILSGEQQNKTHDAVWFDNIKVTRIDNVAKVDLLPEDPPKLVTPEINPANYPLYQTNRDTLATLRMGVVKHNNYPGDEGMKWITPDRARDYAKYMRDSGYNAILTEGQRYLMSDDTDHPVYPDVLKGSLPFPELVENTKAIADAMHEEDMKVFLHLTASAAPMEMREDHPDWMTVSVNTGEPKTVWGLEWICLNNPDFTREYFRRLDILLRETKADGVMIDETNTMYDTCGCRFCREKFKKDTGITMPEKGQPWFGDKQSPIYQAFLRWRIQNCIDFNGEIKKILDRYAKDGVILGYYAVPYNENCYYEHGLSVEQTGQFGEALGLEAISNYNKYWALFIANMKLTRAASEQKDGDVFYIKGFWRYPDVYYFWLLGLSQGAHQYWTWYMSDSVKEERKPVIQWETKYEKLLAGLRSLAKTAVVHSSENNNFHPAPLGSVNLQNSYLALANTMTMEQIPYKVFGDQDLSGDLLKKAETIIVMNVGLLSEEKVRALRQFVADGGTLIASGDTSLYEQNGTQRANFALADVFGCDYRGMVKKDGKLEISKKIELFGNRTGSFNSPDVTIEVAAKSGAEIAGTIQLPGMKNVPGVIVNRYGKGRSVYFAGQIEPLIYFTEMNGTRIIPREWGNVRDEKMVDFFAGLIRATSSETVQIENLPKGVVVETYRHQFKNTDGIQVHLLNYTGMLNDAGAPEMQRIAYPEIAGKLPEPGKPIRVFLDRDDVKSVYAFSPDFPDLKSLPFHQEGNRIVVDIPDFGNYLALYFNLKDGITPGDLLNMNQASAKK